MSYSIMIAVFADVIGYDGAAILQVDGVSPSAGRASATAIKRMVTRSRIQAHSSNIGGRSTYVTKVLLKMRGCGSRPRSGLRWAGCRAVCTAGENPADKPAEALYLQLGEVGLDPTRVYQVRGASLDRSAIHITLEDGTIGFTQDVMGRITGAFFEGDGEVLLTPPNDVERRSMSLFTGMAILEERFATAYFRFNDDAMNELRPDLRATDKPQEFVERWGATAQNLAHVDAMRLLMTFSRMLPVKGRATSSERADPVQRGNVEDQFLHARLQGTKLGVFDVYFDSTAAEQVQAGQAKATDNGDEYYDVWTSFAPMVTGSSKTSREGPVAGEKEKAHETRVEVRRYTITTEVRPPKQIHARARVQFDVRVSGSRALLFELSRSLQLESVKLDGEPVEFIHNPAVEGTQLARRGNDLVAVILPEPAQAGQKIDLEFVYGGEVLAEAGSGLLYVGARGTWYPNRGLAMADFDLEFSYPPGWTLVATGKPTPLSPEREAARAHDQQTSRWVSERPMPLAGFNLGKYKVATVQAGNVTVETYATTGVERDFPSPRVQVIDPDPNDPSPRSREVIVAESSFSSAERSNGGRGGGACHPVLRRAVWALSLQSPGADADAGSRQPGLARAGVSFVVCVSRRPGARTIALRALPDPAAAIDPGARGGASMVGGSGWLE